MQDAGDNTPEEDLSKYDIQERSEPCWMPDIDKHMLLDPVNLQKTREPN